mmetsp:Transcript_32257/g.64339  ORF Transcript_32257/g.64339 Transcript_32257/m.64339 type:complete len:92 (+) Transcript_32257:180-455(+)
MRLFCASQSTARRDSVQDRVAQDMNFGQCGMCSCETGTSQAFGTIARIPPSTFAPNSQSSHAQKVEPTLEHSSPCIDHTGSPISCGTEGII